MYARLQQYIGQPSVIDPNIPKDSKLFRGYIENTLVKNAPANPVSTIELPAGFPTDMDSGRIAARQNSWPRIDADIEVSAGLTLNAAQFASGWSSRELLEEFICGNFAPITDSKGQSTQFYLSSAGTIYMKKKRRRSPATSSLF